MLQKALPAAVLIVIKRFEGIYGNIQPVLQIGKIDSTYRKGIVADNFTRMIFHDFIEKLLIVFHFGEIIIARCDIGNGDADFPLKIRNAHQVVVSRFIHGLRI